ncbi:phosphoethanolamine--lipid A transferase [Halioxenophilus sp. WMMB6]|uniref:phosphoethanolamine transferase n=1 Tax=Halioxenophilus sp. WMMB6 TaxID=3073815 RepID=UPI00295F40D3|nr:phosphoethanolamine--lipid A transferase [Halioxenophilus sp. WMMB6]
MSLTSFLQRLRSLSPLAVVALTALWITATANFTFFHEVGLAYPLADNGFFNASLALLLWAVLVFFIGLFSLVLPLRFVLGLFLVLAAVCGYYTDQFHTIINADMLENAAETDTAEVRDLITPGLLLRLATALLLVALLYFWQPKKVSLLKSRLYYGLYSAGSLLVMITTILLFSSSYASFFREHKTLRSYTTPLMAIYSAIQFSAAKFAHAGPVTHKIIAADAKIVEADFERELIILVVGETARRDHFSLNGYERPTNPLLAQEDSLISYTHIQSCGTATAVSVPCMFSVDGREEFSIETSLHQDNLLDILDRAGVSVLWRDNNSSSKGVANRVAYQDFRKPENNPVCDEECRDVGMLAGLQAYIDQQPGDILIVLHQMGNHGPAYFKRYPPEFEQFKPTCQSLELAECSEAEIINAYDNAILYTDYFLDQVIQLLQANTPQYETAMLYVSDHGESLGEFGLFLHGAPYMLAPEQQTAVPVVLWLGASADIELQEALLQKDKQSSHDAIFHSLIAAFEVQSKDLEGMPQLFETNDSHHYSSAQ